MYKITIKAIVKVTEEVEVFTEYGDYYDSYNDEVDDPYLLKLFQFTEEDTLVEYIDEELKPKLTDSSLSKFIFKDNQLYINSEFTAIKRLTKTELELLKQEVRGQYSDGWYENGLEKTIYNGKKYKDYYLNIDGDTITIKQTKL